MAVEQVGSTHASARRALAVVTGAGSGIGRAICLALVARGVRVLGVGRRRSALEETRALAADPGDVRPILLQEADIVDPAGRRAVAAAVHSTLSSDGSLALSYLIHNAATLGEVGSAAKVTEVALRHAMAVNFEAPLFLTQALADTLASAPGGGRVLHVSSGAAHRPLAGWLPYCTSKAAFLQLSRCLDVELAPHVRVGSAMPGVVDTEMQAAIRSLDFPGVEYFRSLRRVASSRAHGVQEPAAPMAGSLDSPGNAADFLTWLLLDIPAEDFGGREWDIHNEEQQRQWLSTRR